MISNVTSPKRNTTFGMHGRQFIHHTNIKPHHKKLDFQADLMKSVLQNQRYLNSPTAANSKSNNSKLSGLGMSGVSQLGQNIINLNNQISSNTKPNQSTIYFNQSVPFGSPSRFEVHLAN